VCSNSTRPARSTVLGFGGHEIPSEFNAAHYREAIARTIAENNSSTLAFDVSGIVLVPSGILGLWASFVRDGLTVEVYNPSDDVIDVLEITGLDRLVRVRKLVL